ncbi:hypothetical protein O9G_005639 [Rozella allomycis CSF55]|uniref:Uncharacterized protein n=1 Tax=Rozella allomycis (strain CSF55) TaxID=988480 RepID=A0A075B5D8_ROZAC|nr:hypothetical protein O9G_005639 [Rozella allomycis CSF55]|eukprot:EPZ37016.1 hypothetical protein O9G_005639 [Rozella allomycis CSF55]
MSAVLFLRRNHNLFVNNFLEISVNLLVLDCSIRDFYAAVQDQDPSRTLEFWYKATGLDTNHYEPSKKSIVIVLDCSLRDFYAAVQDQDPSRTLEFWYKATGLDTAHYVSACLGER